MAKPKRHACVLKINKRCWRRLGLGLFGGLALASVALCVATVRGIQAVSLDLDGLAGEISRHYFDRHGRRLNSRYHDTWNSQDRLALHAVPTLIQQAVLVAEDKRFWQHSGIDWRARAKAGWQNLTAGRGVRGASTISEQVVRLLHPRPRTLWSRWLEGWEAQALERSYSKADILEFYLNQVPYAANRRGIAQAARYYFDRDPRTLTVAEQLSLAVIIRSPRWYDPAKRRPQLERAVHDLARRMRHQRYAVPEFDAVIAVPTVRRVSQASGVQHFIQFVERDRRRAEQSGHFSERATTQLYTSLDLTLQNATQALLDRQLSVLKKYNVHNAAALVIDHRVNQILAWVVGNSGDLDARDSQINAVLRPRQAGSTLKPFVYALALERGWTPATLIDDSPLEERVGLGMHRYHNYSGDHYGPISLREALGNSLNIPAVRALHAVGVDTFMDLLRDLGIRSLDEHPTVYGDGLALGNGELSLYELTSAYAGLARMGERAELSWREVNSEWVRGPRVLADDTASLVGHILSDARAREKEFGAYSILNFPLPTAVKTGTSSDYRDAWTMAYNDRYTVGVWMGNLDYEPMREITGSKGPALVVRSIFDRLNRHRDVEGLYLSPRLLQKSVCMESGAIDIACERRYDEWFLDRVSPLSFAQHDEVHIKTPTSGLLIASDPRIPDTQEYIEFSLGAHAGIRRCTWLLNDAVLAQTDSTHYEWNIKPGQFRLRARVELADGAVVETAEVSFSVL